MLGYRYLYVYACNMHAVIAYMDMHATCMYLYITRIHMGYVPYSQKFSKHFNFENYKNLKLFQK